MRQSSESRFWSRVQTKGPDDCWTWSGRPSPDGYGTLRVNGRKTGAHRYAYELARGPIPDGPDGSTLHVLHRCDNPPCCNVRHLFLGTNIDNIRDRDAKGRHAAGDRNGSRLRPETRPRGDANGSRRFPERLARGDRHYARVSPERLARGERNGARTRPETRARGDANGSRTMPERLVRGESHPRARLNEALVREIRSAVGAERAIAARFGVSRNAVRSVRAGLTWRHVA